jgi:obg-like ATPase 1
VLPPQQRGFESEDIIHVDGEVDPVRDIAVITGELLAKDISLVSGLIAKMESNPRQLKMGGKEAEAELACYKAYEAYMTDAAGPRQVRFGRWSAIEVEYLNKLNLLTAKPMAYVFHVAAAALRTSAALRSAPLAPLARSLATRLSRS